MAQQYTFQEYAGSAGLANLNATSALQDREGYLWVGTENGLYRYDGSRFQEFGAESGLLDRVVTALHLDSSGRLWVGTNRGLAYFDGRRFVQVQYEGRLIEVAPGVSISSDRGGTVLAIGKDGQLLAARSSGTGESWKAQPFFTGSQLRAVPELRQVLSLAYDRGGSLWLACEHAICQISGGNVTVWDAAKGVPSGNWFSILEDRQGTVWIRGDDHVAALPPGAARFEPRETGLPGLSRTAGGSRIVEDPAGRLVTAAEYGIARWERGSWRRLGDNGGRNRDRIRNIYFDREGSAWLSKHGHGLLKWRGYGQWESWTMDEGLAGNHAWAIARDRTDQLWAANDLGLFRLGAQAFQPFPLRPPLSRIRALVLDHSGLLLAGTAQGALELVDPVTGRVAKIASLSRIYSLTADSSGRVWVGTLNGLFTVSGQGWDRSVRRVVDPVLPERCYEFREAPSGEFWLATERGLFRYAGGAWNRVDLGPGVPATRFANIEVGDDGSLWVNGDHPGILRFFITGNKVTKAQFYGRPTLASDLALFVRKDAHGRIWVGTDRGLDIYDGKAWRHLSQQDGLIWDDCNGRAFFADAGGVWIGTSGGLSHFTPLPAGAGGPPAQPSIFSATLGAQQVGEAGNRLHWERSPLRFEFGVLSFRNEQSIQLRYRLSGLEKDWTEASAREARYPDLSPGMYRFELTGEDKSTGRSFSITSLPVNISPPWWRSFPVLAAASIVVLLAVRSLWRLRIRALVARKDELERIVSERTKALESERVQLIATREALREQATHDGLTKLWNRTAIMEILDRELQRCAREGCSVAAVLADVDHFKRINDEHGHLTGDAVLRNLAARLLSGVRSYDSVGRYGGEEFLLVIPNWEPSAVESQNRVAELHSSVAARPLLAGDSPLAVTCSFGVAYSGADICSAEELLRRADVALYRAKGNGRNRIEYSDSSAVPSCETRRPALARG